MVNSFQNEIPKARVNITLDLETHGAQRNVELPMKLLVVGKFNQHASQSNIASREKINVDKGNMDAVIQALSPQLNLHLPNHLSNKGNTMNIKVNFQSMKDFRPENLADNIPELRRFIAMRNLLKELKANIIDNKTLRNELENILKNKTNEQQMQRALTQLAQTDLTTLENEQ
jgi:type VI secretion system protein ImpB